MRHTNDLPKPVATDNATPRNKPYALTDGGGLLLEVLPSGTKTWRCKYHLNGKREKVTIGAYPAYTIKQARDRHEELRALVERGESPAKSKQATLPYLQSKETTVANQDTPDTTRDAQLEVRVSAAQKSLLQHAAALSGCTFSEFVVTSAQDAARRVIAEHESIQLSREEQQAFVQALLQPPEPNARLKRAAKAYVCRGGQRAGT
jgi:uncharacterized protein (DUF1778 family)